MPSTAPVRKTAAPSFLQQRFRADSTRGVSELLILEVLARLGKAKLSDVHDALRRATQGSETVFFTGQPLRRVLDCYKDLKQVRLIAQTPEPTYELTPSAKNQIRYFTVKLNGLFPELRTVERPHFAKNRVVFDKQEGGAAKRR